MERHRLGPRHNSSDGRTDDLDDLVRYVIRRHERGEALVARELAHFVPRFYGRPASEILATSITDDDARLVVAREHRRANWQELVDRANATRFWREQRVWEGDGTPLARARDAIR